MLDNTDPRIPAPREAYGRSDFLALKSVADHLPRSNVEMLERLIGWLDDDARHGIGHQIAIAASPDPATLLIAEAFKNSGGQPKEIVPRGPTKVSDALREHVLADQPLSPSTILALIDTEVEGLLESAASLLAPVSHATLEQVAGASEERSREKGTAGMRIATMLIHEEESRRERAEDGGAPGRP